MTRVAARVVIEDERAPMRDGVALATDVVRVPDRRRRPALLMRTPYSRAAARAGVDALSLARSGWVVVVQDVRGRFDSAGVFRPFHQEIEDGADSVAWCASRPWCDGNVVTWGGSYVGATQLLCAAAAPAALRAITPVCTGSGYADGWTYEGGALQLGFVEAWAAGFVSSDPRAGAAGRRLAQPFLDDPLAGYALPLGRRRVRRLFDPFQDWLAGPEAPSWDEVEISRRYGDITVPGFHVGGWYDIFCEGTLRNYSGLRAGAASDQARAGQRLVVGPWMHYNTFQRMTPDMDFGADAMGFWAGAEMLDFAARAARGEEVEGGARVFVMGANSWRDLEQWPPLAARTRLFLDSGGRANSLGGDGRLRWENPPDCATDRFRHNPADPVPTRGGRTCGPHLPMPGPVDQRPVEERDDVLVYTSDPLEAPRTVIGPVTATVHVASTAPSADVCVKLVDVWPDGRAFNIVDSVRRVSLSNGQVGAAQVDVGSTAITFLPGHRIRLEVASSNFPRLDRNPSTGEPAGGATVLRPARQTVLHGGAFPSFVELPLVDR